MPWLLVGHQIFAHEGPLALKVERLARRVKKNKSSFYHHFADLEIFKVHLLTYHQTRAEMIIEEESQCQSIHPDLLNVFLKYKQDLLFHRQLLVNREITAYGDLYERINQAGIKAILRIWNQALGLRENSPVGERFLKLGIENLFQRASTENITKKWLSEVFLELKEVAIALRVAR